jgi:hypothetical protein
MKRHYGKCLSLLAALCLASAARADIVTLKSGEKMEGRILSETPDSIEMEYRLTPKIKDKKTVQKSDIATIVRQTDSELEFQEKGLKGLLPTPDLMSASDYEMIIQDKLRSFAAKYPGTPETAEVEKMIATLAQEKSRVLSGEVKMEGKWLDAATAKRETYNVEAYRNYLAMKSKEAEPNEMHYLNALRAFEKLRSQYGASPYFTLAIPNALDLLKKYESQLNGMITDAPILVKKQAEALKTMNSSDVAIAKRANEAELKAYKAQLDDQVKKRVVWKDIYKYDQKGLQDALATLLKERAELQGLDLTALAQENTTIMSIIRFLADKNVTEARALYEKISKEPNLVNKTMLPTLLAQITQAQKEAVTAQKAERSHAITDTPAVAPGKDDSAAVNPVAAELERIKKEKEKKAEDAKKGGAPKPAAAAGAKPADGGATGESKKPATASADSSGEEGGIMAMITDNIPYIGGGLIVVLLLAWFLGRKKKEA